MKIDLPNVTNARSLTGMKTKYGVIAPNRLIRSGVMNRLTDEDIAILAKHNLKRVIDLRCDIEIENAPDVQMEGVQHVHIPIIPSVTFGISFESLDGPALATRLQIGFDRMQAKGEDYPTHIRAVYSRYINEEFCRNGYGKFLKLMANNPVDGATLWHCTMGKDRCGTCALLLEYCLGVDMDTIVDDYLESNKQTRENTNSLLNKARPYVTPDKMELIETMLTVQPYYLEEYFGEMQRKFNGIDGFIKACGVTDEDIAKLRKNYLE